MYSELVKSLRHCNADCFCEDAPCCTRIENRDGYECVWTMHNEAADAIEQLLKAAKKMHLWIFLNSGDEQAAYDWCGLSDEMNAALGYSGKFELRTEPPKEETE